MADIEQEHLIPQQISAYQFRLVGDMTLKQFFQVAGGTIVALILYSTNLPGYVKWPLMIFFFLFGVALAFLPFQDRPLEKWIVAFFRSIYSPTLFVWKKQGSRRKLFKEETAQVAAPEPVEAPKPEKREGVPAPELEKEEQKFLTKVEQQFETPQQSQAVLKQTQTAPQQTQDDQKQTQGVKIPEEKVPKVEKKKYTEAQGQQPEQDQSGGQAARPRPSIQQKTSDAKMAQFSEEAGPPTPPSKPNTVVGQVLDTNGKIIEGAILEIKDDEGRSVRALKTNKLGHFLIVTPLLDGKYEIITEKEGYKFTPITFMAEGEIIPPIAIWADEEVNKKEKNNSDEQS